MPSINGGRVSNDGNGKVGYSTDTQNDMATTPTGAPEPESSDSSGTVSSGKKGGVTSVSGRNIGPGHPIFAGSSGSSDIKLSFKTISAGNGVTITDDQDELVIGFNASNVRYSFLNLFEAPSAISFGVLTGTIDGKLVFSPAPTQQNTVLTFDGMNFVWKTPIQGSVTSVGVTGDNAIKVTGNTITSSGSFGLALANTGVVPGSYSAATITVDAQGRVTSAVATPVGERNVGNSVGTGTSLYAGKTDVSLNFKSLAVTGPLTLADDGQTVTLGANAVTSVSIIATDGLYALGGPVTSSGTFRIGLALSSVTPGTYNSVTVDNYGRVTSGTTLAAATATNVGSGDGIYLTTTNGQSQFKTILGGGIVQITPAANTVLISANAVTAVGFSAGAGIVLTGNTAITSSGSVGIGLSNTTVTPGSYTAASITVDAQGRITAASSTPLLAPTGVLPGTYSPATITVDSFGRITAASNTSTFNATNLGNGTQIYAGLDGSMFQFRSLTAGSNIKIVTAPNDLTISAVLPDPTPLLTIADSKGFVFGNVAQVALDSTLSASRSGNVVTLAANVAPAQTGTTITDGARTVANATSISLMNGLTVTDLGNGQAQITAPTIAPPVIPYRANTAISAPDGTVFDPSVLSFVGPVSISQSGSQATITIPQPLPPSITVGDNNAQTTYANTTAIRFSGFTTGLSNTGEVTVSAPLTSSNIILKDSANAVYTNPSQITFANGTFSQSNGTLTLTANPIDLSNYVNMTDTQYINGAKTFGNTVTAALDFNVTRNLNTQGLGYFGGKLSAAGGLTVTGSTILSGNNVVVQSTNQGSPITALIANGAASQGWLTYDQVKGVWIASVNGADAIGGYVGTLFGNVVGNADTATKLANAFTITLGGSLVGSLTYGRGDNAAYVTLTNTGVSPGTYSAPLMTISADGRITSIQNGISGNGAITAENIGIGQQALSVNGSDLAFRTFLAGNAVIISNTGNELKFDVDTAQFGTVSQVTISGGTGIVATGSPITRTGSYTVSLANTMVAPGTYSNPTVTVDAQGRITNASSGTPAPVYTASNLGSGDGYLFAQKSGSDFQFRSLVAGPGISISETAQSVTVTASIQSTGITSIPVTDGTTTANATNFVFQNATVTSQNGNTAVVSVPAGTVTSVSTTNDGNVLVSGGPITSSGTLAFGLSDTGVAPNTYYYANIQVDKKGRITAASSGAPVTSVSVASPNGDLVVTNATVTTQGTIQLGLGASGVTPGQYSFPTVTVDAKGRVTNIQSNNPTPDKKHSDFITVTDTTVKSYSFSYNGSLLILNPLYVVAYVNRMILRPSEFTVQGNSILFNIDLNETDELEVITFG